MSSSIPVKSSRTQDTPVGTKDNRARMSLANENLGSPAILQTRDLQPESPKVVEKIQTFLIWSIFNLIFVPFGILCCYFSYKVNQFKIQNRYEMAKKWSKRAFVVNIITTLLMVGVIITVVMLRYDFNQQIDVLGENQTRTTGGYIPWQPGR